MDPINKTKKTPAQIVAELREVGLPEVQEFLTVIYKNYIKSKNWQEAPEVWQQTCGVYYLELMRALELMEKVDIQED